MPSEARLNKIMEKLNRAQKCSILVPQNLGSRGGGLGLGLLPVNGFLGPIRSERLRRRNVCVMFAFSRYESYIGFPETGFPL